MWLKVLGNICNTTCISDVRCLYIIIIVLNNILSHFLLLPLRRPESDRQRGCDPHCEEDWRDGAALPASHVAVHGQGEEAAGHLHLGHKGVAVVVEGDAGQGPDDEHHHGQNKALNREQF